MDPWVGWQVEVTDFVKAFFSAKEVDVIVVCKMLRPSPSQKADVALDIVKHSEAATLSQEDIEQLCELLPKVSGDWRYQITECTAVQDRLQLRLSRPGLFVGTIQTIQLMSSVEPQPSQQPIALFLDMAPETCDLSLTERRLVLARDVLSRLLTQLGHRVTEVTWMTCAADSAQPQLLAPACGGADLICVTGNSRLDLGQGDSGGQGDAGRQPRRVVNVVVEPVVNTRTGKKETELTADEYERGKHASLLEAWRSRQRGDPSQVALLSLASLTHQLLGVSLSSPCRIDLDPPTDPPPVATDRAVFALYNYARLQAILDRFDAAVRDGTYPPLPTVSQIAHQFHLLKTQDEWELLWRHLLPFCSLLDECVKHLWLGRPAIHRLTGFLSELSHTFSRYYSRTHVLTPGEAHLTASLHVRIHLLRTVRLVFLVCFRLLGYQPPQRM